MKIITLDSIEVPIGSHENKTIVIGSDHRGFEYKQAIISFLENRYPLLDIGTFSPERCDYPVISDELGRKISQAYPFRVGIGICGSGIGILIPASKHTGVYAARCLSPFEAETSRRHNNSNVLGLGADYTTLETALATVETWLKTPFTDEKPYLDRFLQTVRLEKMR